MDRVTITIDDGLMADLHQIIACWLTEPLRGHQGPGTTRQSSRVRQPSPRRVLVCVHDRCERQRTSRLVEASHRNTTALKRQCNLDRDCRMEATVLLEFSDT